MQDENNMNNISLTSNVGTKKVLLFLVFIFLLFVGYKIISSNVQENKEKAVIQERVNVEYTQKQEQTQNLNRCLSSAQNIENSKISWYLNDFHTKYGSDEKLWEAPIKAAFVKLTDEVQAESKQSRSECYKQFPQ